MNLNEFLSTVDNQIKQMSESELRDWLYEYARKIPEEERKHFLSHFEETEKILDEKDIDEKMFWASDWFDEVEEGERLIYSIVSETEHDGWWMDEDDEEDMEFEDRDQVFPELKQVLEIIDFFIEMNQLEDANELLERLFQIELRTKLIWKYDDYEIDEDFVSVDELFEWLGIDGNHYSYLWMYVIAQIPHESKFDQLLRVMIHRNIVKIEWLQTVGPNEVVVEHFIDDWIQFLAQTKGKDAYIRLLNACQTYKTQGFVEEHLSHFTMNHPKLFLDVLAEKLSLVYADEVFDVLELKERVEELSSSEIEEIQAIIELADRNLPEKLTLGAEIMEIGYELSKREKNSTQETYFRKRAFRFRSSMVNYLRLRPYLNPDEHDEYKENWKKWPKQDMSGGFSSWSSSTQYLEENTLTEDQQTARLFFSEELELFLKECQQVNQPLGWSQNILGFSVPLCLLLLYRGTERTPMLSNMMFTVEQRLIPSKRDRYYFDREFRRFKHTIVLTDELEEDLIEWLSKKISERTAALLDAKHTNAYYRAAELIIAYGEVMESKGVQGARAEITESYRKKYNRFNRFTRELKERL